MLYISYRCIAGMVALAAIGICLDLIPRIMAVPDHESIVWRVWVGLLSSTIAARQPPKGHPEVLADERVYEGVDG